MAPGRLARCSAPACTRAPLNSHLRRRAFGWLPIIRNIPANLAVWGSWAGRQKAVFFFRSTLTYQEGEGQPPDRTRQDGLRRAFTPAVVLFIALPEAKDNIDPGGSHWTSCRGDVRFARTTRS